jgi:O-antigen/teichoic acid export membrane protein
LSKSQSSGLGNLIEAENTKSLLSETVARPGEKPLHALPLSRRLSSALSLTGLGSITTVAVSALAHVLIARNGGPAGYANYVAANMFVFVTAVVCGFGVPMALAKHVAIEEEEGRHEKLRHTITTTIYLTLLVTLIIGTLMTFVLPRLELSINVPLGGGFSLIFPLVLLCAVASDCVQGIYTGLLRPRVAIAITMTGPLVVIVYILVSRAGISLPIWGAVAAFYICGGILAIYKARRDRSLGTPAGLDTIKPILKDLAPAATFTFFIIFSSWSDRWIVSTQVGAIAMGSYAAAVVVIQAVLRVPIHIAYVLVPASSRVALGGAEKSRTFNRTMISAFITFAIFMTVLIALAPTIILQLIFGPGFRLASPALMIMALSLPASAISIPFISTLTGSTRNRLVIYLLGFTLVPRILLLLYLTRRWSLVGTALATVGAEYILAICCLLLARKIKMSFPLGVLVRPVLTGAAAFAVGLGALFLNAPQIVAVSLAAAIFAPASWRAMQSVRKMMG